MRVLHHHDFRCLLIGQAASTIGDRIVFVALALYVTEIGSPTDVGIVLAAATLPLVAFLLIGGVWADRLPRHRVMIVTDLIRFALHAVLAALIFTGGIEIWQLVVIEALFGTAEAFFRPAYTGLVPQTVPEELIQDAKAAGSTIETVAEFAGPALATVLVLGLGAGWAFALDALTFLVSAAFLTRVRPRERGEIARAAEPASPSCARATTRCASAPGSGSRSPPSGWPCCCRSARGRRSARRSPRRTTARRACSACCRPRWAPGRCSARIVGFRWRPEHPMRVGFMWTLAWPAVTVGFALGLPLPLLVPLFAAAGVGLALFGIWWETALAERVPPHTLSRVSSYDWMGSLALLPLGFLLAGPLGEALGPALVLGVGSALAVLVLAAAMVARENWTLRRLEPV